MRDSRLTKVLLRLFVVSITVTAIVGILALISAGRLRWLELRVLLTTATIAAASICGLACGACLSRGHKILPTAGLVLTALSACSLLVAIWLEVGSESYWMATLPLIFFAVACSHLSLLYLADLAGGYRWAYLLAYQLILGLAALLSGAVLFEFFDDDSFWRLTGVVSILVAAITLLIPVFHYLSREEIAAAKASMDPVFAVDEEIARLKKRLIELESKRRALLGREPLRKMNVEKVAGAGDSPAR